MLDAGELRHREDRLGRFRPRQIDRSRRCLRGHRGDPLGLGALGHRYDHICSGGTRAAGRRGDALATYLQHLGFAITVDPDDRVLRDAAVVVNDDRISDVGPTAEVLARHPPTPADELVDGSHLGVCPGFVDTHVHLSETLSRASFPDVVDTRTWVFQWVMPYYGELTAEDERVAVLVAATEMLRSGTTCFLDMGALIDPRLTVPVLAEVGIRAVTGRHAADVKPDPWPDGWSERMVDHHFFPDAASALAELEACVRELDGAADGRIRCWVNIQGKEPCSAELHAGARALSESLGVGTTYHIASTAKEADLSEQRYGARPVARMEALGALGANLVLAHAVALDDEEVAILARRGASVAFCPGTSLKLAKGATAIGRYPELLEAGVTVGLGTDGVSASGNLNMMRQMHLAAGLFKDARRDPTLVGAQRALRMATIDGARALRLDPLIGSLEPGKKADLVLFDLTHPEWVPYQDPVQALVWSATTASIHETWVDGRRLYAGGRVATVGDEDGLRVEASERARALLGRTGLWRADVPVTTTAYE
jgi:cytosine/adenosine deaminase-related metal-dependent hydrolase